MIRICAVALSASLLLATSMAARASALEAEWLSPAGDAVGAPGLAFEIDGTQAAPELASTDTVRSADVGVAGEADVAAALAPDNFLDPREDETNARIAADLAAVAEATGSIAPLVSTEESHLDQLQAGSPPGSTEGLSPSEPSLP